MAIATEAVASVPWWKEPTKDQWIAWWAAWLGWTLDAFDFTVFLLIMVPISQEFGVPLVAVTAVFTITLWLRLVGATASGWLADRVGRKIPLMISILWFSLCNFIAGFSPNFAFLFFFRALLGIGMGAEWPAGASLAMESWPVRSRGFMSGVLQGSWGLGFLLSSVIYGLFYSYIGWRGMLWIGILPALAVIWVRKYVKEPEVWLENRRKQRAEKREMHLPLFAIFKRGLIGNTLTACWWMASCMVTYYSIWALFATHLQKDLGMGPVMVGAPLALANLIAFLAMGFWGWVGDVVGRRWSMIIPAAIGLFVTPTYLLTADPDMDRPGVPSPVGIRRCDVQPDAELPDRALPHRGAGNGERFLLSSGGDLWRVRGAGSDLLRRRLSARFRHPDADRHHIRVSQRDRRAAVQP